MILMSHQVSDPGCSLYSLTESSPSGTVQTVGDCPVHCRRQVFLFFSFPKSLAPRKGNYFFSSLPMRELCLEFKYSSLLRQTQGEKNKGLSINLKTNGTASILGAWSYKIHSSLKSHWILLHMKTCGPERDKEAFWRATACAKNS